MSRRGIIALIVIALLLVGGYGIYRARVHTPATSTATKPLRTVPVRKGRLQHTVEATGNIAPIRQSTLTFGVAGTVERIYVQEGDRVVTGTLLAKLDTRDLELQERNAQETVRIQEAALAALRATPAAEDVQAARAALEQAQARLDQLKAGPSPEELAAAQATLNSARETYERLRHLPDPEDVEQARLKVEQAKNSLWSAQVNRDDICGKAQRNPALWAQCERAKAQVGNAEIAVKLAELAYKRVQTPPSSDQIAAALAKVRNAEATLAKLRSTPSEADIAAAEAQMAQAKANLARLLRGPEESAITQAQARLEQARIALEQIRHNLEKARIVAPFAGIVANIPFEEGDSVTPNGPGIVLLDPGRFYVDLQVNEVEIGRVALGQPVTLSVDAFPDTPLTGTVSYISPVGQTLQGVVTYRVRVDIDPTDVPLLPGMTATAQIAVGQKEEALLVPLLALHSDARGDYVEILRPDGTVRKVYVHIGERSTLMVEVRGDLKEGDLVVLSQNTTPAKKTNNRPPFGPNMFRRRPGGNR